MFGTETTAKVVSSSNSKSIIGVPLFEQMQPKPTTCKTTTETEKCATVSPQTRHKNGKRKKNAPADFPARLASNVRTWRG